MQMECKPFIIYKSYVRNLINSKMQKQEKNGAKDKVKNKPAESIKQGIGSFIRYICIISFLCGKKIPIIGVGFEVGKARYIYHVHSLAPPMEN